MKAFFGMVRLRRVQRALLQIAAQTQRRYRRWRSLGARGERIAERYLRRQGMKIVARQMRLSGGEIDLIAVDGNTVVFVEVKTRRTHAAGHPFEAITADKQRRLTRLALLYLRRNHLLEYSARFDVVAITWPADRRRPEVIHLRNAFEPADVASMFA